MTIKMKNLNAVGTLLVFSNGSTAQVPESGIVEVPSEDYLSLLKQGFTDVLAWAK